MDMCRICRTKERQLYKFVCTECDESVEQQWRKIVDDFSENNQAIADGVDTGVYETFIA